MFSDFAKRYRERLEKMDDLSFLHYCIELNNYEESRQSGKTLTKMQQVATLLAVAKERGFSNIIHSNKLILDTIERIEGGGV